MCFKRIETRTTAPREEIGRCPLLIMKFLMCIGLIVCLVVCFSSLVLADTLYLKEGFEHNGESILKGTIEKKDGGDIILWHDGINWYGAKTLRFSPDKIMDIEYDPPSILYYKNPRFGKTNVTGKITNISDGRIMMRLEDGSLSSISTDAVKKIEGGGGLYQQYLASSKDNLLNKNEVSAEAVDHSLAESGANLTLILKSGKIVDGKVIEETDDSIRIEYEGIALTYYLDEIEKIQLQEISEQAESDSDNMETVKNSNDRIDQPQETIDSGQKNVNVGQNDQGWLNTHMTYGDLLNQGRSYLDQEDYTSAVSIYSQAIALYESNPIYGDSAGVSIAYSARARAYQALKENEKALADYDVLVQIEKSPEMKADYLRERAKIAVTMERYQQAISDYDKIIQLYKETGKEEFLYTILRKRGDIYRDIGDYEKAIFDYTEAIQRTTKEKYIKTCYFYRGLCHKALGNKEQMQEDLEKADSLGHGLGIGKIKDGEKHGLYRWYYPNGNLKVEGNYVKGVMEGEWKRYHENGELKSKKNYINGEVQ